MYTLPVLKVTIVNCHAVQLAPIQVICDVIARVWGKKF